jgi:protein-tyrosine phosphatase
MQTIAMTPEPTRLLPLEGTYNVRDVGGYATADGGTIRWRTLLRGDSLHRLTAEGQALLITEGLRTVIDLRRASELAEAPNVFVSSSQIRYRNIALIDGAPAPAVEETRPRSLGGIYERILETAHPQLRAIMEILGAPGAFPVLVHCTAGKDRTGIIIALLLGLAEVSTETIAADYALSEAYLGNGFVEEMRARIVATGGDWSTYEQLMVSPHALMLTTMAVLIERYGSVAAYLRAIGVPGSQIETVRAALIA